MVCFFWLCSLGSQSLLSTFVTLGLIPGLLPSLDFRYHLMMIMTTLVGFKYLLLMIITTVDDFKYIAYH